MNQARHGDVGSIAEALAERTPRINLGTSFRVASPQETLERVLPFQKHLGITRIANITGLDWLQVPVFAVFRPNSRSVSVSQGKGTTPEAARVSGVMEAAELAHAEDISLPVYLWSYLEASRNHEVVDVSQLPASKHSTFDENAKILWIEGYDLIHRESVLVPFELVTMDTTSELPSAGSFLATSNGLASGNHLVEAISHAIAEVVERDATTLWRMQSKSDKRDTSVDLSQAARVDPDCANLLTQLANADVEVLAWDMTTDIGIPTFSVLIAERIRDPARSVYTSMGMGAHSSWTTALLRAITEAAQSRLTLISGNRDDVFRDDYSVSGGRLTALETYRDVYAPKHDRRIRCDAATFPSIQDEVRWQVSRLEGCGINRVVVCDLTDPRMKIPVVRVIVPGLEGYIGSLDYTPGSRARAAAV